MISTSGSLPTVSYENSFLVLSGKHIFDAETESTVTFSFVQEDSADSNSTRLSATIDGIAYSFPFYLRTTDETHLYYSPLIRIEDADGDGIDEIFIQTYIIHTEIGYLKLELAS